MSWYVIQTYTGKEEKLVQMVRKVIPRGLYGDCFVVYHEQLRHRKQENQIHIERLFPGYVFITTDEPEELFLFLKKVPAMSKIISDGYYYFLTVYPEEAEMLSRLLDADHVVRLSYVATDGRDHVSYISGPLECCGRNIAGYQFRKRYASVRLTLAGESKDVRLGIVLSDDVSRELKYGKVEAPIQSPERYEAADRTGMKPAELKPGDAVTVISGTFEGMPAVICRTAKCDVEIGVHFFGRDMTMKVPVDMVRKTVA